MKILLTFNRDAPVFFKTKTGASQSKRQQDFVHFQDGTREPCILHTCTETQACLLMFMSRMHVHTAVSSLCSSLNQAINFRTVYSVKDMRNTWRRTTSNMVLKLKLSWMLVLVVSALPLPPYMCGASVVSLARPCVPIYSRFLQEV